jgi:GTP-binding protein
MRSPFAAARFLKSAPSLRHSPPDQGSEVAVAGRSNAGKSSTINALIGLRKLARTSRTPGCTRHMNFFDLGNGLRLVDLPGYGYAKVPGHTMHRWPDILARYLSQRRSLRGLLLVMDIRHALSPGDRELLPWCRQAEIPVHLLLNKADKLSRMAALEVLRHVRERLQEWEWPLQVQLFSARTGQGVDLAREAILAWTPPEGEAKKTPDRGSPGLEASRLGDAG